MVLHHVELSGPHALAILAFLKQIIDHPADDERGPLVGLPVLEPIGPRSVVKLTDCRCER
eukprot:4500878-Alexandrium_andersonii.AAC.1